MADEIMINDGLMLSEVEYTGELTFGEGLVLDGNEVSVSGKMNDDFIQFVATEDEAKSHIDNKLYVVTGTNEQTSSDEPSEGGDEPSEGGDEPSEGGDDMPTNDYISCPNCGNQIEINIGQTDAYCDLCNHYAIYNESTYTWEDGGEPEE